MKSIAGIVLIVLLLGVDSGSASIPFANQLAVNVPARALELGFVIDLGDSRHDDQPAIQAVLQDPHLPEGSVLWFPAGTYNLQGTWPGLRGVHLNLARGGITLVGEGMGKSIFVSELDDRGRETLTGIRVSGISGVKLRDFTLTSSWKGAFSTDTDSNNPGAGGLANGIHIGASASSATTNVTVERVLVERFRRAAFRIDRGSQGVVLLDCEAKNATDVGGGGAGYGFVIQGAGHSTGPKNPYLGDELSDTHHNVIQGCRTSGPYLRHSVLLQYWTHHNRVTNGTYEGSLLDSIDLHGEDEYSNEIDNNRVIRSLRAGIALGNTGAGHDKSGRDNWIHHNELVECVWGITVQFGTEGTKIENNHIRIPLSSLGPARPFGVLLGKSREGLLRDNRIVGDGPSSIGIVLVDDGAQGEESAGGPRRWILSGNTVQGAVPLVNRSKYGDDNLVQTSW